MIKHDHLTTFELNFMTKSFIMDIRGLIITVIDWGSSCF